MCRSSTLLPAVPACTVSIAELVDIEENIWAPRYGLKGQLDATLRVHVTSREGDPSLTGGGQVGIDRFLSGGANAPGVKAFGEHALASKTRQVSDLGVVSCSSARGSVGSGAMVSGSSRGASRTSSSTSSGALWSGEAVSSSAGGEVTRSYVVPFEFKSGKDFIGHRGQVSL